MVEAKNIFASKTFQGATLTLLGSVAPIVITCFYDNRFPTKQEMIATAGLFITFGWTLVGRSQNTPVYTPDYLPGANQSDFENQHR